MLSVRTRPCTRRCSRARSSQPPRDTAPRSDSVALMRMGCVSSKPCDLRSSVTRPTPARIACSGDTKPRGCVVASFLIAACACVSSAGGTFGLILSARSVMRPRSARSAPNSRRINSVRPEPTSPAMPKTSPACSARLTSCTAVPRPMPSTCITTGPATRRARLSRSFTERPTMRRTRSSSDNPAMGHTSTSRPSRNTATWVAMRRSSSSRCDTYTMATPRLLRRAICSKRYVVSRGVSMAVGSSSTRMRVSSCRLRAISTICCWPMPSCETGVLGSMVSSPILASCARAAATITPRCSQPARWGMRPSSRFSATVSVGTRPSSCITMRTPWRSASRRDVGA